VIATPARPPRTTMRRAGSETSWMLGFDDGFEFSIVEKSFAMADSFRWRDSLKPTLYFAGFE
jgi:hypothetical protein